MSKESKPRDLWAQVFSSAATRPNDFCTGCGYYAHVNVHHRADCTSTKPDAPGFRQVCQLKGTIAPLPESSAADHFPSAADGSTPKVATSLTWQRQVGTASPAGVDHPH